MAQMKSFLSTWGSKFKTFVNEEHQTITQFLKDEIPKKEIPASKEQNLLPPWLDISTTDTNLFEEVKNQIMNLTKSKRNFLNAPPEDSTFTFSFEEYLDLAQLCLKSDPMLSKVRFYLVPKYIREPQFWRNYFFRVYLIKEAYGLNKKNIDIPQIKESNTNIPSTLQNETSQDFQITPTSDEFVSDSYSENKPTNVVSLSNELGQLGISPSQWETELRNELETSSSTEQTNTNIEIDEAWEEQLKKELEDDLNK
jgi:hypothetical protein